MEDTDNKHKRELAVRERTANGVSRYVIDTVQDLLGEKINATQASDVAMVMPSVKNKKAPKYYRSKQMKSAARRARKRKAQVAEDEVKLAALKAKLYAGDPNHPMYEARLAAAKKRVGQAMSLPVVARQKWGNPKFQEEMEEKGHRYNPAKYNGQLPFEMAKYVQKEIIGAKSRGEYEFFVKLYDLIFLPARPDRCYEEEWKGWSDFLGIYNTFGATLKNVEEGAYRSFFDALTVARSIKAKNVDEWKAACVEGRVPLDVPIDPHNVYPEFVDMDHWLGLNTALDLVTGKVEVKEVWVLYRDGRMDACWWAKMSDIKLEEFVKLEGIQVERVYEFEGHLAEEVWKILDRLSDPYEDDRRERYLSGPQTFGAIKAELDNILKWRT